MSEAFDNVGVMMLLHQKMMRDAEVATAYQLMVANPEEEEPPKKKRKHNWWFRPMLHPQLRAEGRQISINLPPLCATCRLYKYRPSATWFRPSSAAV